MYISHSCSVASDVMLTRAAEFRFHINSLMYPNHCQFHLKLQSERRNETRKTLINISFIFLKDLIRINVFALIPCFSCLLPLFQRGSWFRGNKGPKYLQQDHGQAHPELQQHIWGWQRQRWQHRRTVDPYYRQGVVYSQEHQMLMFIWNRSVLVVSTM